MQREVGFKQYTLCVLYVYLQGCTSERCNFFKMITTCTLLLILSFTSIALSVSFSLVRETRRSCFRLQSSPTTKDGNIVAFNTKSFQGSSNTFRERNEFPDWLIDACEKNGYVKPTEMQEIALPVSLHLFLKH